jgi:hypothetical protein
MRRKDYLKEFEISAVLLPSALTIFVQKSHPARRYHKQDLCSFEEYLNEPNLKPV